MGCFLPCFGSSKDAKCRKHWSKRNKKSRKPKQPGVSSVEDYSKTIATSASASSQVQDDKPKKRFSLSRKKKVTFGCYAQTHEPVLPYEVTEFSPEKSEEGGKKEDTSSAAKSGQSTSSSEDSSLTLSGSYPLNHRYQNWRDSNGEDEDLDYSGSDLSDENDEDDVSDKDEENNDEEVGSPKPSCDNEVKSNGWSSNARDRSIYDNLVLNPVEDITTPTFSTEPSFSLKSEIEPSKKLNQENPVDGSLSNWLVSSEATPVNEANSYVGITNRSISPGSNSVISHEDRPILGALTIEEIRQFSVSCTPRKSPCRSPDEMPIIGTVGTYWNCSASTEDSSSASCFKRIPNTTSKYKEDKRVNWHETPFETRLERALTNEVL